MPKMMPSGPNAIFISCFLLSNKYYSVAKLIVNTCERTILIQIRRILQQLGLIKKRIFGFYGDVVGE